MRFGLPHIFKGSDDLCDLCQTIKDKFWHRTVQDLEEWPYARIRKPGEFPPLETPKSLTGQQRLCIFCGCLLMKEEFFQRYCEDCSIRLSETSWTKLDL